MPTAGVEGLAEGRQACVHLALHGADGAPDLDVMAMIRDGEHHAGRRRTIVVVGGAAAAVVALVAGIAVPTMLAGDVRTPDVAAPVVSYDLAYAVGSTIHDGSRTVETDVAISGLVQAPSGYVVVDRQGRVHTVVDGGSEEVGRLADADRGRLVSDDDVVAWIDAAGGGTLSVLDLATGDRTDVPVANLAGEPVSAQPGSTEGVDADIAAVDGRTVYLSDARGVMAWDVLDDEDPVLLPAPDDVDVRVLQVEEGQILQVARTFEPQEVDGSTTMTQVEELRVGRDLADTRGIPGTSGSMSPDGQRVALQTRVSPPDGLSYYETVVGDVDGGSWTPVAPEAYDSVQGYQWLDADTFAAAASVSTDTTARQDLLTCEADTAACTVALRGGGPDSPVIATGRVSG